MSAALLLELHEHGVGVRTDAAGKLHLDLPAGGVSPELREKVVAERDALLAALGDPAETAYRAWNSVVQDVTRRWNDLYSGRDDAPWVDVEWEYELTERIGGLIRAGDLAGTLSAIGEWRAAWEVVLAGGPCPLQHRSTRQPSSPARGS